MPGTPVDYNPFEGGGTPAGADAFQVKERPRQFVSPPDQPARMINAQTGSHPIPDESPMDRGIYEAGGKVTDVLSNAGMPPPVAALGGTAANLGLQGASAMLGGGAGAKAAPMLGNMAKETMYKALKPGKVAALAGDADKAVSTLLDQAVNVTKGGVDKLTSKIDKLYEEVDEISKNSKNEVSTLSVVKSVKEAIQKFRYGLDHAENEADIRKEMLKFFNHPEVQNQMKIPVPIAQAIRRATDKEVGHAGYQLGTKAAGEKEGKMAVAGGLREGLGRAEPEIAKKNAEMSDLINARKLANERVTTARGNQELGLGALVDPRKWPLWLAQRNPGLVSARANALNAASKNARPLGQVAGGAAAVPLARPPEENE
jgi:hypothetical protein